MSDYTTFSVMWQQRTGGQLTHPFKTTTQHSDIDFTPNIGMTSHCQLLVHYVSLRQWNYTANTIALNIPNKSLYSKYSKCH